MSVIKSRVGRQRNADEIDPAGVELYAGRHENSIKTIMGHRPRCAPRTDRADIIAPSSRCIRDKCSNGSTTPCGGSLR